VVKSYCWNLIPAIVLECEQKDFTSRYNLNTGNPFVHIPKQLLESDSDNNFLPQPNALTKIRLYPENKI
jgi:hypothetical protein